jgi:hypothetical protein
MVAHFRIITATALVVALATLAASAVAEPRPRGPGYKVVDAADPVPQAEVVAREQSGAPKEKAEEKAAATGQMEVFDDIEQAWNARNVDQILRHFGAQKVAISIEGTGPSGTFSRSQSYYLLKDHFRYTNTRKFEFVQFRESDESSESYAIAERHYLRRDDGRLIKDKVYVSLHLDREGDREKWVVDEIKSIR